jgi:hypothetical protein
VAFASDTICIWDPSGGSNNNGIGFAASDGGVRITTAIAYDDLVIDAADNTKITSAADRAFVANDAGNWINVQSGTGWTVQRARIVSVAAGIATMDRAMGTVGSTAGTGVLGGYGAIMTDAIVEAITVPGCTHELWATGTMTLTGAIAIDADGTAVLPVTVRGMSSAGTANPTGNDRPLIASGTYGPSNFNASYWIWEDVRFTGTGSQCLRIGGSTRVRRCSAYNSSTTADRSAFYGSQYASFSDCEAQSAYGIGFNCSGSAGQYLTRCYIHDCNQGAGSPAGITCNSYAFADSCIIDTCSVGIVCAANAMIVPSHCTIYGCPVCISGTTAYNVIAENNIFAGAAGTEDGPTWTTAQPINWWDYNCHYNLDPDRTNVAAGAHDFDADPLFTNAANGDFSRTETDADGIGITLGVG